MKKAFGHASSASPTLRMSCSPKRDPLLVRLLNKLDQFDPERLKQLYESPLAGDVSFEELIIRSGLVDETQVARAYADHYLMPLFEPPEETPPPVDPKMAEVLPGRFCRDHLLSPLSDDGHVLEVAVVSPDALALADQIKLLTGRQMRPLFTTLSVVQRLLAVLYDEGSASSVGTNATAAIFAGSELSADLHDAEVSKAGEIVSCDPTSLPERDPRILRHVKRIFEQALQVGASDIHIEPYADSCRVRLRIDGVLAEITPPPLSLVASVIRHLKVLSKMDVAERQLPQDGAIKLRSGERRVAIRVNTCPTVHGEKVAMKLLDANALPHELTALGLDRRQFQDLSEAIRSRQGLILVTGPPGSGKRTTLYSCLNALNDSETNICTVEDPVKVKVDGINQVQTRARVGLTFPGALRSLLRQDPDVIMVGELRDNETAEICTRAALTGRFVLSTLPSSDALGSVTRLQHMGMEPLLLASTVRLLVAQRLLRRLCDQCKQMERIEETLSQRYGFDSDTLIGRPMGCRHCRETGYNGHLAIFEVIRITSTLSRMIQAGKSVDAMRRAAVADGTRLLPHSSLAKVASGETSLAEALSLGLPSVGLPSLCLPGLGAPAPVDSALPPDSSVRATQIASDRLRPGPGSAF